jgi:hypothetical protein
MRSMQERANILENMAAGAYINEQEKAAMRCQEKALETRNDTLNLRRILRDHTLVKKRKARPLVSRAGYRFFELPQMSPAGG